jgi:hypothetical protein
LVAAVLALALSRTPARARRSVSRTEMIADWGRGVRGFIYHKV